MKRTLEFTLTGVTKGWDADESVEVFRAALMEALAPLDLKSIRLAITTPKAKKVKVWTGQTIGDS